jgi:hypothetical protein
VKHSMTPKQRIEYLSATPLGRAALAREVGSEGMASFAKDKPALEQVMADVNRQELDGLMALTPLGRATLKARKK